MLGRGENAAHSHPCMGGQMVKGKGDGRRTPASNPCGISRASLREAL